MEFGLYTEGLLGDNRKGGVKVKYFLSLFLRDSSIKLSHYLTTVTSPEITSVTPFLYRISAK